MRKILMIAAVLVLVSTSLFAQKVDYHCSDQASGDDSRIAGTEPFSVSPRLVDQQIKAVVRNLSRRTGGWFEVKDSTIGQILRLKLKKVLSDELKPVGKDSFFACTEFKTSDGRFVDMDFVIANVDGQLSTREATLHRVEGIERYSWVNQEGYFIRSASE